MIIGDHIRRLPLFYQRSNDGSHILCLFLRHVDALARIDKRLFILCLCGGGSILELIKPAVCDVGAAIAGTGTSVPSGAVEGSVVRAGGLAFPAMLTMPVIAALQGHVTLVGHNPVKLDLLSYGRLVFAEFVGNGGLGHVIIYSLFDDLSVLKGKV